MRTEFFVAVLLLWFAALSAAQDEAPLVHLGFEDGLATDGASQDVRITPPATDIGAAALVEGIVGQGLRVGDPKKLPQLAGSLLGASEGTLSFWIKPDGKYTATFNGPSFLHFELPGVAMLFYKIYGNLAVYESVGPQMTTCGDLFLRAGEWRMLTFVYKQGYRCTYLDDVPMCENKNARNDFVALSKGERFIKNMGFCDDQLTYDELTTWPRPFTQGEVAALFYARRGLPKGPDGLVLVPPANEPPSLAADPAQPAWAASAQLDLGFNSYTGARISSPDTVRLTHRDNTLYLLYRMPLPKDYVYERTRFGGAFFKVSAKQRDDEVLADDCIVVDLSPDGGKTRYRFAMNTAGTLYDARNGDKTFNHPITGQSHETQEFWTGALAIPLAGLGEPKEGQWSFNFTRIAQHMGFAKRQVFYTRGSVMSWGNLQLGKAGSPAARVHPLWDPRVGTLETTVDAASPGPLTLEMQLEPLDHRTLFPSDKGANDLIAKLPMAPVAKISKTLAPADGKIKAQVSLALENSRIALSTISIKDSTGQLLFRDAGFAARTDAGSLQLKYIPSTRKLYAEITLPSATLLAKPVSATFSLRAAGAEKVLASRKIDAFKQLRQEAEFDLANHPVGDYEVEANLLLDGKPAGVFLGRATKQEDPVWVGSSVGLLKTVPKPWTPLAVSGDTVKVWGRNYTFAKAFLPTRLTCLDHELLAAPVRLTAEVDGKPTELKAASVRIEPADPAGRKAALTGEGTFGPLAARLSGWIEFDGFSFTRIGLKTPAARPVTINNLTIEIPLRKEMATLYDVSGYTPIDIAAGLIPKDGVKYWAAVGQRVGTGDCGLQWTLAPDPAYLAPNVNTLTITPANDHLLLRLVLVTKPKTIQGFDTFEFGLQGLPTRPFPRELQNCFKGTSAVTRGFSDQEMQTLSSWKRPLVNLYTEGWSGKWNYLHFSQPTLAAKADAYKATYDQTNHCAALYLNVLMNDGDTPEYVYYQNEWSVDGSSPSNLISPCKLIKDYPGHDNKAAINQVGVCIDAKSYRDFYCYYLDQVLTSFQSIPNPPPFWVYFDVTGFAECTNPYIGGDRNKPGGLHTYLTQREFMQRAYAIVHAHDPRNMVTIHNSGMRVSPVYGFADLWIEGEQFTANWGSHIVGKPKLSWNDCYPTVLSLDQVRAQFNSHAWGPAYVFLSQFWEDPIQQEDAYRKAHSAKPGYGFQTPPSYEKRFRFISGLMRVHDNAMWGELTPILPTYDHLVKWGWDDTAVFIPYWDPKGAFAFSPGEPEKAAVSAWYRPDGKLLMCVFNGCKETATIDIALHPEKFPVVLRRFTKAADLSSPDPVFDVGKTDMDVFAVKDNRLTVPVRAEDYRLLRFDE